jgi:peptidoglycan/xylan/chitin deacetylase (PgdA/CDA1 family)
MPDRSIVFLMYHELEIPGRSPCQSEPGYLRYVLSEADFRSQILWLKQAGWRGMSVSEALALRSQDADRRSLAFTFDDGCESDFVIAAPILREVGYSATFYVTVGFIGQPGYMNAAQVRELSNLGFEVGCHSMNHAYLTDLDDSGLQREISQSKTQLEQILGKPVEHFSCPGGRCSTHAIQVVRGAGYRSVATSRIHGNTQTTDSFSLGRVPVLRQTGLPGFQKICRGEGLWKLQLRAVMRDAAKQLLGNSLYDHGRALLLR